MPRYSIFTEKYVAIVAVCFGAFLFTVSSAHALGFLDSGIWLSKTTFFSGDTVRIYSMVINDTEANITGNVIFYANNKKIGTEPFVIQKGEVNYIVGHDWTVLFGDASFSAEIIGVINQATGESISVQKNNAQTHSYFADDDTDGDRIGDQQDKDDDNDGIADDQEATNRTDPKKSDSDGDGVPDQKDYNPLDPSITTEPDTDRDGTPDSKDSDQDNDGLYNFEETSKGSNPLLYDTDRDGASDKDDAFPSDPKKQTQKAPPSSTQHVRQESTEQQKTSIQISEDTERPAFDGNDKLPEDKGSDVEFGQNDPKIQKLPQNKNIGTISQSRTIPIITISVVGFIFLFVFFFPHLALSLYTKIKRKNGV